MEIILLSINFPFLEASKDFNEYQTIAKLLSSKESMIAATLLL